MKFSLSDEQSALSDATRSFMSDHCSTDVVRAAMESPLGYDQDLHAALCNDLGLAGLIVPEEYGGLGAGDVEWAVVSELLGYFLVPSPLRTHIAAEMAIVECADPTQADEHLSRLASGEEIATIYFADDVARDFAQSIAQRSSNGAVLSATFEHVPYGHVAHHLYFFIGTEDSADLVYVDLTQDGVSRSKVPSIDQTIPLGRISLTGVYAQVLTSELSKSYVKFARSRALIAISNEMVGATQACLDMSVSYAKDRVQFGQPIGSFQAIKHKCADMLLETESSRSIALYGAWRASCGADFTNEEHPHAVDHVASMAKYYCSKASSHCAGENIQIHGGIGFTFEHDAQLYFKRAAYMNAYMGMPHDHAQKIAEDVTRTVIA